MPVVRYGDMLLFDHLFIRLVFPNRHKLSDEAWRAAQPLPHQIRDAARRGIRTIVNLRGPVDTATYAIETEACQVSERDAPRLPHPLPRRADPRRGSRRPRPVRHRRIPDPDALQIRRRPRRPDERTLPVHASRRANRQARRQLSLAYGHIRHADTGVLDHFLDAYVEYAAETPIEFYEWVETVYDPDEVTHRLHSRRWANRIVDGIFRRE